MTKIKHFGVGLAIVSACFLTACGGGDDKSGATSSDKSVRIVTESSFRPFSYLDTNGEVVGFEIDLARALCDEMKATQCDIISQDWDSLIPSLQAGKADAIMAGMSVTEERKQVVDFSDSYFENTLVLVGKKGDTATINDVAGKKVGTQQATVSAEYLEKNQPQAIVSTYDKQDNAYLDLSAGRIEYMLSDIVPMLDWLKTEQGQGFEVKGEPIDIGDHVAIALLKGSPLKDEFNTALASLKSSGKYDSIKAKYFEPETNQEVASENTEGADSTNSNQPQ